MFKFDHGGEGDQCWPCGVLHDSRTVLPTPIPTKSQIFSSLRLLNFPLILARSHRLLEAFSSVWTGIFREDIKESSPWTVVCHLLLLQIFSSALRMATFLTVNTFSNLQHHRVLGTTITSICHPKGTVLIYTNSFSLPRVLTSGCSQCSTNQQPLMGVYV